METLCSVQPLAHAAHVHGDGLGHARGHAGRAAVADLLIDSDVAPDAARRNDVFILQIFGVAQQNAHGQLVVQEAALDVALLGHAGARIKADEIARGDAQRAHVVR